MPPDVGTGVTLGRVNIPTHSCLTTQELANAIRLFQVALGVGPAREGDPIYQIVIATEEGDIINANAAGVNTILAAVNEATHVVSTDATFDFDGAVAITGAAPGGGTGTATNSPAESYTDNEQVILLQGDDNSWRVIGRPRAQCRLRPLDRSGIVWRFDVPDRQYRFQARSDTFIAADGQQYARTNTDRQSPRLCVQESHRNLGYVGGYRH
jgi:hypothetical protein